MTGQSALSKLNDSQFANRGTLCKPPMINIVVADGETIFRAGMARVLAVEDDLRIVAQPQSAGQMLRALEHLRVHVLLVSDSFLPALCETRSRLPRRSVAVLVVAQEHEPAAQFVAMGAQGVLYRSADGPTLVTAVRRLASGGTFIHIPRSTGAELRDDSVGAMVVDQLSDMEIRIIGAVFQSCRNREIAQQLGITEHAVKHWMRTIFDKIGVSDRLELALFVYHHRLLEHTIRAQRLKDNTPLDFVMHENPSGRAPQVAAV